MSKNTSRTALVILGPHRSGTSALSAAIAGGLKVDFGKHLIPPSYDNPKGFYENEEIVKMNEALLGVLLYSWEDPVLIRDEAWISESVLELWESAKQLVIREYDKNASCICIKDPRMCKTFPFWKGVLLELGYDIKIIINYRSPIEIASSLAKRNLLSQRHSDLLITSYYLSAIQGVKDLPCLYVHFEDLIKDYSKTVKRISRDLGIEIKSEEYDESIIDAGLRHHKQKNEESRHNLTSSDFAMFYNEIEINSKKNGLISVGQGLLSNVRHRLESFINNEWIAISKSKASYATINIKDSNQRVINSEVRPLYGMNVLLTIDLKHVGECREVELILANKICPIEIVEIDANDGSYELKDNAIQRNKRTLYFDVDHPKLIFQFKQDRIPSSIEIKYSLLENTNNEEIKRGSNQGVFEAIVTAVAHPRKLLSQINYRNYKILRSALRRESPKQIVRNFIKLLTKEKAQDELTMANNNSQRKLVVKNEKPLLLYITPELPAFDKSSGGRRADQLLRLLTRGYQVLCYTRATKQKTYIDRLWDGDVTILTDDEIKNIKKLYPVVDVLVFAFYYTYYDEKQLLNLYPYAKKIIDSVDVHWVREERQGVDDGSMSKERLRKNKKRELDAYTAVDGVWVVSEPDKIAVLKETSEVKIDIVSNIHEVVETGLKYSKPYKLFFLGNYNHLPNISAATFFAKKVLPRILESMPNVELWIAGTNATEEIIALGELPQVRFLGYLSEDQLVSTYEDVVLSVAPLFSGAGVKGKILESIAYMTPVVTNDIGNEGIGLVDGISGFVIREVEAFADSIVEVLSDTSGLAEIASQAQKDILDKVSPEMALNGVNSSLCHPIDICIVTYNKLDLLKDCINSIIEYTSYPNYRVLVYSNGCTDGTQEYLKNLSEKSDKVVCFLSGDNEVFVRPNNKLMNLNKDSDVVLLNNDTAVTKNWLSSLHKHAYRHDKIGIVGSKILYPDGRLQEYGSEIYEDGRGMNFGKGGDPEDALYQEVKVVSYVSGCAMFIKRSTIEVLKGFDDQYHPCYYEDSDLCYRAWKKGIYTIVVPDSIIRHHEGASAGTDVSSGFKQYQMINKEKFVATHKSNFKPIKSNLAKAKKEFAILR